MPDCDVCGGDEYYEEDGQYYCKVCNTQSQSMVVMEAEEDPGTLRPFGFLKEVGKAKTTKKESVKKNIAGRPWTKYEAYQLIIQAQADALIAHGAKPFVKDAILRLWAKYLSELGVAFCEGKTLLIPKGMERIKGLWHRELHHGGLESPAAKATSVRRTLRKNDYLIARSKAKLQKLENEQEKEGLSQTLHGETFYEGDNPEEDSDSEEEGEEESVLTEQLCASGSDCSGFEDEEDEDSEGVEDLVDGDEFGAGVVSSTPKQIQQKIPKHRPKAKAVRQRSVRFMNLQKTLAFCYLGCLFSGSNITVADVLRWAHEGSLPYLEPTHLLHEDMKLSAYDHHLFQHGSMSSFQVFLDAGKILIFLGTDELPPLPIKQTLIKFVRMLDLPDEMERNAVKLLVKYPPDVSRAAHHNSKAIPLVDAICAAYIFVTLKLIFGLNDWRERQLAEFTRKLQARLGKEVKLFDWTSWQNHVNLKFLTRARGTMRVGQGEGSVESLCDTFKQAGYKDQRYSLRQTYTVRGKKEVAAYEPENRDLLNRPIHTLLERLKNREANEQRNKNAASGSQPSETLPQAVSDGGETGAAHVIDCKTATVKHITDTEEFLCSHLHLLADQSSHSVSSPSQSQPAAQNISRDDDDSSSLFSGSGDAEPDSSTLAMICGSHTEKESVGDISASKTSAEAHDTASVSRLEHGASVPAQEICSCSKVQCRTAAQFVKLRSQVEEGYELYPRLRSREQNRDREKVKELRSRQHLSYKWLLGLLSSMTFCKETDIERKMYDLEEAIGLKLDECSGD